MKLSFYILASLLLVACIPICAAAQSRTLRLRVESVIDGETLTAVGMGNVKTNVKLYGISAPKKEQAGYNVALKHLGDLISGKEIIVQLKRLDEDNNVIGIVYLADADIGAQMIRDGAAWYYEESTSRLDSELRQLYLACQGAARSEKRGIWKEESPLPPWEFARRQAQENPTAFAVTQQAMFDIAIRQSKVVIGMDTIDVERAWGTPRNAGSLVEDEGSIQIWYYKIGRVYFRNGRVYQVIMVR